MNRRIVDALFAVFFVIMFVVNVISIATLFHYVPTRILLRALPIPYWLIKVLAVAVSGFYFTGYLVGMDKKYLSAASLVFVILSILEYLVLIITHNPIMEKPLGSIILITESYIAGLATAYNLMS